MKKYDVIIIGAGIAGLTAAIYVARANKTVLVLEEKVEGGQIINTVNIENWPGDMKVSGVDLIHKITSQVQELGAELDYTNITKIEQSSSGWKLYGDMDEEYEAKTIILAMGTNPRKISDTQTADAGKRPISYCATCDGALYKGKKVVVIGHGNTAEHEIKYLKNIASKVYQIHHDDPIPEDAEAIFVAIGRIPATECAKGLVDIDSRGYIVAGEDCRTSTPGIFVAGDCRTKDLRQLVTAASDGAIAATNAVQYLG